jgi:hypothetical protein
MYVWGLKNIRYVYTTVYALLQFVQSVKEPETRKLGDGSTDLWHYTSTKLKIVHCWLYSPMHKNQNLNFNNMKKTLYNKDLFLNIKY